jgi:hypothetical protein
VVPETYIVRIYRRSAELPDQLAGRVETPNGTLGAAFATLAELTSILGAPKTHFQSTQSSDTSPVAEINVYRQELGED